MRYRDHIMQKILILFIMIIFLTDISRATCSIDVLNKIEKSVQVSDEKGHGPDLGSEEWQTVVELRLDLLGKLAMPDRNSEAWCHYVEQALTLAEASLLSPKKRPSFDCTKAVLGSSEAIICRDESLASLDKKLAEVLKNAQRKAHNEHPKFLTVEQKGWLKGRDECWKAQQQRVQCMADAYRQRIAELQAKYRLVSHSETKTYSCQNEPANEVLVTLFHTQPSTVIAERGDQVSLMYQQSNGHYVGRNEQMIFNNKEIELTWGHQAPVLSCIQKNFDK